MAFKVQYIDQPQSNVTNELETYHAPSDESYIKSTLRSIPGLAARGIETAIGLPRDIAELGQAGLNLAANVGIGHDPAFDAYKKLTNGAPFGRNVPFLPSAQNVREYITEPVSQFVTGKKGALEPQGPGEKFAQQVIQDAVPFLFGTGEIGVLPKAARALGVSTVGNLAKFGAEQFGLGETTGNVIKAGTMLGTSLIGGKSAKDYASNLYNEAEKNIPETALVDFQPIREAMKSVNNKMKRGAGSSFDESKSFVTDFFNEVKSKVKLANTIEIKELPAFKKLYNQKFGSGKVPKGAKAWMHEFFESYDNAYKTAPESMIPEINKLKSADNIYTAINAQNNIDKFISNNKMLSSLFKKGGKYGVLGLFYKPTVGISTLGGYQLYDLMEKFASYPGMQKYYVNTVKSLLKQDAGAAIKNAKRFADYYIPKGEEKPTSTGKFRVVNY